MEPSTPIYRTLQKIHGSCHCNVAFIGGSLTVATGASDGTSTNWRKLFVEYLYTQYHPVYHCQPGEIMSAVGAMESYAGVFLIPRNVAPNNPDLCFLEFSINDRGQPDRELCKKGIEGCIRQLKSLKNNPDVVLIGAACRRGTDEHTGDLADHSLHKEIAEYYGLAFIDVQEYIYRKLEERGQTWDNIAVLFLENDVVHLNDYGNRLWFEAMREWFEQQDRLYMANRSTGPSHGPLIAPKFSDELQHTQLIDPSRRTRKIELEGNWEKKSKAMVPWYMDNILMGHPGDRLAFTFTGTTVGLLALVHQNGLKIEAKLDGTELVGPFTKFHLQFGKFYMLGHGLENKEHVLELTVAQPSPKLHKLENPTAEIGYLTIAAPKQDI
ncbi:MAG: hypothetical protein GF398_14660 [Chitinivibrionales bacterium]|nr:hypothetical protein [Chitinivibrionales bacterium]